MMREFSQTAMMKKEIRYIVNLEGVFCMNKVERIFKWLNDGYSVKKVGQMHTAIAKSGKFFNYTHFGSSAIKANKKELEWLLTEVFDEDDEF